MYDENKHKLKVRNEVSRRGLGSYMNETKWRELLAEISKLPFPPPYQRKDVLHSELSLGQAHEKSGDSIWIFGYN